MYHSELRAVPARPQTGQGVRLHLTVRDGTEKPVPELPLSHEKPMHLMIVSKDLRHFAHLHPASDGDGLSVEHTFDEGGDYLLVADYRQPGRGQVVDRHTLHVDGIARAPSGPLTESSRTQRVDGLELTLKLEAPLHAGEGALLRFDVSDQGTGLPAADLEPYLGARAHVMALSADGEDFVHAHALDDADGGSSVTAHAAFPRSGLYKVWVQLRRRSAVVTVPFVLRIGSPRRDAVPTSGRAPSSAHAHHEH